jgi:hypothetical protein
MVSDGKSLEALVAFVEETLLPDGFKVTTNERIFNDEGIQIAEFDIEIRGKVGTTEIAWLIECRDRPTSGAAPGSWIEQLVGRRTRFGFNKITAVSTTGFAAGATEFAFAQGIELREVKSLSPTEFADWLLIRHIHHIERQTTLLGAIFLLDDSESKERQLAVANLLLVINGDSAVLKSSKTGETTNAASAFASAADGVDGLFDDLIENGPEKRIKLQANYSDEDHFVIETSQGPVPLRAIVFEGELRLKETLIPLMVAAEYRSAGGGEVISQMASFAPQSILGMKFSTELHRMADSGKTHVVLRRLADNA